MAVAGADEAEQGRPDGQARRPPGARWARVSERDVEGVVEHAGVALDGRQGGAGPERRVARDLVVLFRGQAQRRAGGGDVVGQLDQRLGQLDAHGGQLGRRQRRRGPAERRPLPGAWSPTAAAARARATRLGRLRRSAYRSQRSAIVALRTFLTEPRGRSLAAVLVRSWHRPARLFGPRVRRGAAVGDGDARTTRRWASSGSRSRLVRPGASECLREHVRGARRCAAYVIGPLLGALRPAISYDLVARSARGGAGAGRPGRHRRPPARARRAAQPAHRDSATQGAGSRGDVRSDRRG